MAICQRERQVYHEAGQYRDGVACLAVVVDDVEGADPWAVALSAAPQRLHHEGAVLTRRLQHAAGRLAAARGGVVDRAGLS